MKSKKFVLAALVLLAAITGLLALAGCKNDTVPETPEAKQEQAGGTEGNNDSTNTEDNTSGGGDSGTVPPEAHTHTFNEAKWESDATGHWHPANCGHTEEKGGFASHTFDWKVETQSTDTEAGKLVKKCTTCSEPGGDEMEIPADFVYIPAGTFQMGSTAGNPDENPVHGVTISKGYFMGWHEVTQKEYEKYCSYTGGEYENPTEQYGDGDDYPAYYVSWYDAVVYCNRRSIAEDLTPCYAIGGETDPSKWGEVPTSRDEDWDEITCNWGANGYRLPTEAEWEYAARAGDDTTNARTWSGTKTENDLGKYAWYSDNSENKTHQVGKKDPNAWGLHDMSGNVWEWCWDWYGNYSEGSVSDPHDGSSGDFRVDRGGSWYNNADKCTVSRRSYSDPSYRNYDLGFRLVRPSSK